MENQHPNRTFSETEQSDAVLEEAAETAAKQNGEPGSTPFRVFATKEEYQNHFDKIMGQRLKAARKNAEKLERLAPLLTALEREYGVSTQEELFQRLAEVGPSGGQDEADNQAQLADTLKREFSDIAGEDCSLYGDVNVETLSKDRKFLTLLSQGFSVKEAYNALHLNEMAQKLAQKTSKQIINNILARGSRPPENAQLGELPGAFVPNVAAMNNDEIDALLARVQKGENISF